MSHPEFLQSGFEKQLAHLVEELGELIAAAGKTQRFGAFSVNPLLPAHEQVSNIVWLKAEMKDVREALDRLQETIEREVTG